jgi:hypothetical protein
MGSIHLKDRFGNAAESATTAISSLTARLAGTS